MGTQLSPQRGIPPFSALVSCGQTDGWIKMPLGTEVSLVPCGIVLDEGPTLPPPPKGHSTPTFRLMSIVAKRLDRSRCHLVQSRPRRRPQCARRGSSFLRMGHSSSHFSARGNVAKQLDRSRCHLVKRSASAQTTFYNMGTKPTPRKGVQQPIPLFGPCPLLWPNGRPSQLLLRSCIMQIRGALYVSLHF